MTGRRPALVCLALACLAVAAPPARAQEAADASGTPEVDRTARPNIVLILSDDEDVEIHARAMRRTRALIAERGTVFENAFVTFPLCCPSRASILRGQYPHNTGVLGNRAPNGGFEAFRRLGRDRSTIGTWLQAAGYRTAFYGKYLNGYGKNDPPPPGWDEWHVAGNSGYGNFDYVLNENGTPVAYGHAPEDYLTDLIARKASAHLRRWADEGRPFLLHVAPFNPHRPFVPAPRHAGMFGDAALPRPPSFNEADVSDKPPAQTFPALRTRDIEEITAQYRLRLEALQSIDELVETLVDALDRAGVLDSTYLIYTSDNGFHLGEHRMRAGKDSAYEEDIRVPLAVRGPGVRAGRIRSEMVLNIDLAPTIAALAGVEAPHFVDGRSLLPLLEGETPRWRSAFLVRRIGFESDLRVERQADAIAIRTARHTLVGYENGDRELYDNLADPYQLDNIVTRADRRFLERLGTRLTRLKGCAAAGCRRLENQPIDR